jgi:SAM-dependent methyltransferase
MLATPMSPDSPRVDSVRLQNLVYAHRQSAVLLAALELGLFTQIARGARSLAELTAALGISDTNAERLLTACAALDLVRRRGDRFENAPDVERFLVEGGDSDASPWILTIGKERRRWLGLAEALRRTDPPRVLGMYEDFDVEQARALHEATYSIGMGAGRRFVRQVDLSGCRLLLDLGGGSGCYSIQAAKAHPALHAIVFDLPPVAVVAREFIAHHGLSDRIRAVGGDFTRDPLPEGADVAIMASNLPQYGREPIARVVARAHAALAPGGHFHLIGEMLRPERDGPPAPALWGLAEALDHSTGIAHSEREVAQYLEAAGFEDVSVEEFVPGSLTRVTGRKAV